MRETPAATAPPVAVGGVGGSGTRLVARLLRAAGIHIGDDLNSASDALSFTLLFKRVEILDCDDAQFDRLVAILSSALAGTADWTDADTALIRELARRDRPQHPAAWLGERAKSLLHAGGPAHPRWGWKEPNTHVVIERLWQRLPTLRYVHVVRHGLEMAFSGNQNQLMLWGAHVLGEAGTATPARSLAYWCRVHQRMQRLLAANRERMYWLDYDALCRDPEGETALLCDFLQCDPALMKPILDEVRPPAKWRHDAQSIAGMTPSDLAFVRSLGYRVHGVD